jgi:hypothetical protein
MLLEPNTTKKKPPHKGIAGQLALFLSLITPNKMIDPKRAMIPGTKKTHMHANRTSTTR